MGWDAEAERQALRLLKMMADHHEEGGELPPEELQAIRYRLATQATVLNSDACRFPRCDCPRMACTPQKS